MLGLDESWDIGRVSPMRNSRILLSLVVVAGLAATQCGDKQDLSKYDASCKKVLKCDKSMSDLQNNPNLPANVNLEEQCQKSLAAIEKKAPASLPKVEKCIADAACEELSLATCLATAQAEIMQNIPGAQGLPQ